MLQEERSKGLSHRLDLVTKARAIDQSTVSSLQQKVISLEAELMAKQNHLQVNFFFDG